MTTSMSSQQRVAVVTGGSRGIGRAIALELARRGDFVIINYVQGANQAAATIATIEAAGGRGRAIRADVARPEQVRDLFQTVFHDHGRVDVLVNNAGITRDEFFLMMKPASWDVVLNVNLHGVYYCCKAVSRAMCAAGQGVIINIGSGSGISPRLGQVNYGATKAALLGFTRSLARELAPKGVRALVVAPGFTRTEMSQVVPADSVETTLRLIPLGRWGLPEEIATVVDFMASDDAAQITGQTIVVDGGRTAGEQDFFCT
jgi:3-oxoacyl-[acyl-carrier protein] reductase